jgi:hypothetical protein
VRAYTIIEVSMNNSTIEKVSGPASLDETISKRPDDELEEALNSQWVDESAEFPFEKDWDPNPFYKRQDGIPNDNSKASSYSSVSEQNEFRTLLRMVPPRGLYLR